MPHKSLVLYPVAQCVQIFSQTILCSSNKYIFFISPIFFPWQHVHALIMWMYCDTHNEWETWKNQICHFDILHPWGVKYEPIMTWLLGFFPEKLEHEKVQAEPPTVEQESEPRPQPTKNGYPNKQTHNPNCNCQNKQSTSYVLSKEYKLGQPNQQFLSALNWTEMVDTLNSDKFT